MIAYITVILKIFLLLNLIYISAEDIKYKIVPWKGIGFAFFTCGLNLMIVLTGSPEGVQGVGPDTQAALGLLAGGGIMLAVSVLIGLTGCLGGGDIWLFWALGLFCGTRGGFEIMITSFLASGIFILIMAITSHLPLSLPGLSPLARKIINDGDLAFVPFISLAFALWTLKSII